MANPFTEEQLLGLRGLVSTAEEADWNVAFDAPGEYEMAAGLLATIDELRAELDAERKAHEETRASHDLLMKCMDDVQGILVDLSPQPLLMKDTRRLAREYVETIREQAALIERLTQVVVMCLPMLEHVECEDPATCGPWEAGEECDRCCSSAFAAYLAKDLLGTTTHGADALRQVRAEAWTDGYHHASHCLPEQDNPYAKADKEGDDDS